MRKTRLLTLLALLMTAATGAWAQNPDWVQSGDEWDDATKTLTVNSNPGNEAYHDQEEIKHVVISSTVTSIGNYAFGGNYYLETVIASEGLETIAEGAFSSCENLESVTLPSTLQIVDQHAFAGDSNLKSVTITAPALNEDYGYGVYAFEDTHANLKIYVPEASVATYKTKWSDYADKIEAIGSGSGDTKYTVTFAANNNTVNVENITLPHTFSASYNTANEEFDLILKELYGWSGNPNYLYPATAYDLEISDDTKVVSTKPDSYTQCLTINNVFEGSVTVKGTYVVNGPEFEYTVAISISAPAKYTVKMADDAGEGWTIDPTEAAEGTPVTATYSGSRHVKSVTAVVKALTITVGGQTVYYVAGDSWATALARPENAELGWNVTDNDIRNSGTLYADSDHENAVSPSSPIDATKTYSFFK